MAANSLVVKLFLGVPFVTDDVRLKKWLEDEKLQTHDTFEKNFPGFITCCRRAIKELEKDHVHVHRLEYIKGKIVAYPPKGDTHPPSETFIFLLENS